MTKQGNALKISYKELPLHILQSNYNNTNEEWKAVVEKEVEIRNSELLDLYN